MKPLRRLAPSHPGFLASTSGYAEVFRSSDEADMMADLDGECEIEELMRRDAERARIERLRSAREDAQLGMGGWRGCSFRDHGLDSWQAQKRFASYDGWDLDDCAAWFIGGPKRHSPARLPN